jgi:hypothetical protein
VSDWARDAPRQERTYTACTVCSALMMTSAANAIAPACENFAAMKSAMGRVTACLVSVVMGQRASAKSTIHS